jgi:hypothetical protein
MTPEKKKPATWRASFRNYFWSAYIGSGAFAVITTITGGFEWYFYPLALLYAVPIAVLVAAVAATVEPQPPPIEPR